MIAGYLECFFSSGISKLPEVSFTTYGMADNRMTGLFVHIFQEWHLQVNYRGNPAFGSGYKRSTRQNKNCQTSM